MDMVCDAARKEVAEEGMVDGVRVVTDLIKKMLDSNCMSKVDVLSIPAGIEILGPRTVFVRECRKTGVLHMFVRRNIDKAVASELYQHMECLCNGGIWNEYELSEKMLDIVTMAVRYDKQGVELGDWEAQYGSMGAGIAGSVISAVCIDAHTNRKTGAETGISSSISNKNAVDSFRHDSHGSLVVAGADSDDEYAITGKQKRKYGHKQPFRVHKRMKVQCAQCISRESQLAARMTALATARATLASESADSTVASAIMRKLASQVMQK